MDASIVQPKDVPVQAIDVYTDTRDILAHARRRAEKEGYADWLIVDIDAHHVETVSWKEVIQFIDDPVLRDQAVMYHKERFGAPPYGLNGDLGLRYQDVGGRIPHQSDQREKIPEGRHRDAVLTRRAMDSLGVDYMAVFPTPMLFLGMHPQPEMEVALTRAYNRWLTRTVLPQEPGIKALVLLPFNTPEEACRTVEEFRDVEPSGDGEPDVDARPVMDEEEMKKRFPRLCHLYLVPAEEETRAGHFVTDVWTIDVIIKSVSQPFVSLRKRDPEIKVEVGTE